MAGGGCRECHNITQAAYRQTPKGKAGRAKQQRNWAKKNPRVVQSILQKTLYGITLEEKERQVEKQGNACAICRKPFTEDDKPVTDHCHSTDKVRGQLCRNCNSALGLFGDNTTTLENAIAYLKETQ